MVPEVLKVWLVSREIDGLAGAGGLKDVVRGLADSLLSMNYDVTVIIPRYGFIDKGRYLYKVEVPLGKNTHYVDISETELSGIKIHLLDAPCFSSKTDIYNYTKDDALHSEYIGKGHIDANNMNVLFQAAAVLDIIQNGISPDVINGHDGHTGLLPLYMKKFGESSGFFKHTGVLITIHNAGTAYQQILGDLSTAYELTGIAAEELQECLLDNQVNPLMAAGVFGHVNTVSPGYARELLSGIDKFSGSLGAAYKSAGIQLKGIYNGINPDHWLNKSFLALGSRLNRRRELCRIVENTVYSGIHYSAGKLNPEVPWIVFHGRLTQQKGVDAILNLPEDLEGFAGKFNFIFYGQGEGKIVEKLRLRAAESSDWLFFEGYNRDFTVKIIASASFVVVPSMWEPCGQIDMIGQLLGAIPIVRSVGGLKKIRHRIDGFKYSSKNTQGLLKNLKTALNWEWEKQGKVSLMRQNAENVIYGQRIWRKILIRGYLPLYRKVQREIKHCQSS
ncbi:MAG: hypothetical protein DRP70_00895 [Spirochaetes bacterium]|nr:MAG: hypothetical protein DRP70_00895 [Spirochaetota bacterium]RKX97157.1 MAG: hypothetical protein DRZ90_07195 [Spirochaetota bacterium]